MTTEVPVLVVGGGPVGLTTALELAHFGVEVTVVEPRVEVDHSRPRAKTTSARTMELYRRTGAAAEIRRRVALPVEWSQAIRFCTTVAGDDVTWFDGVLGLELDGSDLTSEAAQQVTQPVVEEALRALLADHPRATMRLGSRVVDVDLAGDGPRATIEDAAGSASIVVADYLVGADGSRSVVRGAMGAQYEGAAGGRPNVNITFRSHALRDLLPERAAIHHWVLNPAAPGVVGPLDLDGTWWAIATGTEAIADTDEAVALVRALVGADIDVEVLATDPWQARLLIADTYRVGRAFLVGDAAHQNPPWGGHGFNTGVGDAVNLAFKIAAVIQGWAPPKLLDSYEVERRPIAQQTIELAAANMRTLSIDLSSADIMSEGPARDAAAAAIQQAKHAEFHSRGLVLGYAYGPTASQPPGSFTPAAEPGARLPHSRNAVGESLFDLLGPWFTLLGADTQGWMDAASRRGIPLTVVDPATAGFAPVADGLVLVRPDQHIAWIGPASADPVAALEDALRGFLPERTP